MSNYKSAVAFLDQKQAFMEFLDDMFEQFAEAFLGNMEGEGDIPCREKLKTTSLDYTLDSLKKVDEYLDILYNGDKALTDIEYQNVVVWGGAYIGEVIRRNAIEEYHWVHYDEHMKDKDAGLKNLIPLTLTTHTLLVSSSYLTLPMNKVARWLDEGDANNVHFYASGEIARKKGNRSNASLQNPKLSRKPWWKIW